MFTRPKRGEDEDDLLKFQQEFLKSQENASAKIVKRPDKRTSQESVPEQKGRDVVSLDLPMNFPELNPPKKKSRFKESRGVKVSQQLQTDDDPEERLERHDQHITKVLSSIVEHSHQPVPVAFPSHSHIGFPIAHHRQSQPVPSKPSKKSIFAQQFENKKISDDAMDVQMGASTGASSHIVDGTGLTMTNAGQEAASISQENTEKIASMSEAEILEEQKNLLQMLDPRLISFLKTKQKQSAAVNKDITVENVDSGHDAGLKSRQSNKSKKTERVQCETAATITEGEMPLQPSKEWVNMDKVEADKLQWMKGLPTPEASNSKTGQQARFDFQGKPVSADAEIPVHMGLHHHGDEPDRPGYNLEELFTLARSANSQQKSLSLQTISRIIKTARQGELTQVIQTPLLPSLIDGGLVFLLRWAIDDTPDSVVAASISALHALLVNEIDEACLDSTFFWYDGCSPPPLCSRISLQNGGEEDKEDKKTDADLVKEDVIKGLLKMSLLPRLRYILEVCRPQAQTVEHILDILIRVARHSRQSAYEVLNCPRLLDTICKEFLPRTWSMMDSSNARTSVYGLPVRKAVKLMRVISTAGRNMCAILISKYEMASIFLFYIASEISAFPLPNEESLQLQVECLHTWKVCASYGYTSDTFRDAYPVLMEKIQQFPVVTSVDKTPTMHHTAAMLGMMEAMTHLAATTYDLEKKLISCYKQNSEDSTPDALPIPAVHWNHVTGLIQPIELSMKGWWTEFVENYHFKKFNLSLFTSCTDLVASYYLKAANQPGFDAVSCLQHVESLYHSLLVPLIKSQAFASLTGSLIEHSMLLCQSAPFTQETPTNLPSLTCACITSDHQTELSPLLSKHSPFCALTAICRLVVSMYKLHKGLPDTVFQTLLQDGGILSYLRRVCTHHQLQHAANYLCKFENVTQFLLVKIASIKPLCDRKLYHQVSLSLFTRLHSGDDHYAHDLLSSVLFSADLIPELEVGNEASLKLSSLQLDEKKEMVAATQQAIQVDRAELLQSCMKNLSSIRSTYLTTLGKNEKDLFKSRSRRLHIPHDIHCLLTPGGGQLLIPRDWMFLPVLELYQEATKIKSVQPTGRMVASATSCLYWVLLLESWRPQVIQSVSIATRVSRLMCVFLVGNELFLEPTIQHLLAALLQEYCSPNHLDKMNFNENIPGLSSFYDLYMSFLLEYEAASFGDSLFSCFVLLPIQQRHSIEFRRQLWSEHTAALRSLFIPVQQLLIPIKSFLEPDESDAELVRLYLQALMSGNVRTTFCPVLYLVAVHHVNRFMYLTDGKHTKLKSAMLTSVKKTKNGVLKQHLLFYKTANTSELNGMEMYTTLPLNRCNLLAELTG